MYRVNKYVPNCVGNDRIRVEDVFSAEDVLYTDAYQEAVGDSKLYWRTSSPFNFRTYTNDLTCDMLFFKQDDHGQYWGALHVKTDSLVEMHKFLQAASVRVVTDIADPNKPIETITDIDNILKPYENQVTRFALETVRGRMIERISAIARCRHEAG